MDRLKEVFSPYQLLDDMQVEETIFPNVISHKKIVILSHRSKNKYILRIYQLLFNNKGDGYEFVQKLATFTFEDRDELICFLDGLSHFMVWRYLCYSILCHKIISS